MGRSDLVGCLVAAADGLADGGGAVAGAVACVVDGDGDAFQINIPANGVIFYCFAVKEGGAFDVVIDLAA